MHPFRLGVAVSAALKSAPLAVRRPSHLTFQIIEPQSWIAHAPGTQLWKRLCLPTASALPTEGSGDFGTSAFFGQLSDKPLLVRRRTMGASETKHKSYGERLNL
jgi:hypothetical protein